MILLIETAAAEAGLICERLCQPVRDYHWSQVKPNLPPLTISVGFRGDAAAKSPEALVATADRRLYLAKIEGKDRVAGSG